MADYATNLFFASTENERDLDKVEAFDDMVADCFIERFWKTCSDAQTHPFGFTRKKK